MNYQLLLQPNLAMNFTWRGEFADIWEFNSDFLEILKHVLNYQQMWNQCPDLYIWETRKVWSFRREIWHLSCSYADLSIVKFKIFTNKSACTWTYLFKTWTWVRFYAKLIIYYEFRIKYSDVKVFCKTFYCHYKIVN